MANGIEGSGELMSDAELDKVTGGLSGAAGSGRSTEAYCNTCKRKTKFTVFSGGRAICNVCGKPMEQGGRL